MRQEITVKANAHEDLKPLVAAAIRNQLVVLQRDIESSSKRIEVFERESGMASAEFERKMGANQIEDTLDALNWMMELASLRLLQGKYKSLCEAEIS